MKAVTYHTYGPPDVLRVEEIPTPSAKEDEVLIRVMAAEVTKSDCELRSFRFPVKWFWLPLRIGFGIRRPRKKVLGGYFSGVVEATGPGAAKFKPGDEVFGVTGLQLGAYGEYVALPQKLTIVPKPKNIDFSQAASALLGGLNALHFLRKAELKKGEKILIIGAGGSIGLHAVQIAKAIGAEVTAVDATHKEEMLRRIGADDFVDYKKTSLAEIQTRYDVVFNMVATTPFADAAALLAPGGRYMMGNPRISDMFRSSLLNLLTKNAASFSFAGETEEELLSLAGMIEEGKITPLVDRVFHPSEAAEAHRLVETEQRLGSIVLSFAGA